MPMKGKREHLTAGKLRQTLQLPDDLAKGNILVSLHGQERLCIENFKGISSYSEGEIRLMTRSRCICITGRKLEIVYYTKDEIEITGHIVGLTFVE